MSWARAGFGAAATAVALIGGWAAARSTLLAAAMAGLVVVALLPAPLLLVAGVIMSGGTLQTALVGPLIAADLLLLAWLTRNAILRDDGWGTTREIRTLTFLATAFVAWSLLATYLVGGHTPPLMRIGLYVAVMLALARRNTNATPLYVVVLIFAIANIAGGIAEGQVRLVGLYVGDPAQMGALILAALIPLVVGDLRFPGWRLVAMVLLGGVWLTQTRSVWFATAVVLAAWVLRGWLRRSPGRAIALVLFAVLVGLRIVGPVTERLGLNADSADYRTASILNGIASAMRNPWLGSGWARVESINLVGGIVPYNLFVNVFASVGFPGLVLLVVMLWAMLRTMAHHKATGFYFAIAVLAMSATEMTFYAGSLLTVLFFVYAGVGLSGSRDDDPVGPHPQGVDVRADQAALP